MPPDPRVATLPAGLTQLFAQHARQWRENVYVYAVVARRSGGVSIGVNLNPDKSCNFDCIYCQVDRRTPSANSRVQIDRLAQELDSVLAAAASGDFYRDAPFSSLPPDSRVIRDIAFSGDGEPTTCPEFHDAVRIAAAARARHNLMHTKLVLITDACYLAREPIRAALRDFDAANGEIWAKLDAGTEDYFQLVNRPNFTLDHVLANILDAARVRPVVIQSLWMRVHGQPPPAPQIDAYCRRLNDLLAAGGKLKLIQTYTIARTPAESFVQPLADDELDAIALRVSGQVAVPQQTFHGLRI